MSVVDFFSCNLQAIFPLLAPPPPNLSVTRHTYPKMDKNTPQDQLKCNKMEEPLREAGRHRSRSIPSDPISPCLNIEGDCLKGPAILTEIPAGAPSALEPVDSPSRASSKNRHAADDRVRLSRKRKHACRSRAESRLRATKRIRPSHREKTADDRRKRTVKTKHPKNKICHHKQDSRKSVSKVKFERKSASRNNNSNKEDKKAESTDEYRKRLDFLAKFGKNFYCPTEKQRSGLRPIYIDGSNVAFSHGQNERFSVQGLKICIDYFRKRGHEVKAFVPHFRLRRGKTTDQALLHKLVTKKLVITTPTLYIQNQRRNPYDDWYIVQTAAANGGIIVSADNFQDILKWNPNLRPVIEECRLVPTFVDDMLIFPVDPHGNRQNNLEQFLRY